MRISDWSSDVCSSDLLADDPLGALQIGRVGTDVAQVNPSAPHGKVAHFGLGRSIFCRSGHEHKKYFVLPLSLAYRTARCANRLLVQTVRVSRKRVPRSTVVVYENRSEEHTSELQSLMRISYAVFCLKKKKITDNHKTTKLPHQHKESNHTQ